MSSLTRRSLPLEPSARASLGGASPAGASLGAGALSAGWSRSLNLRLEPLLKAAALSGAGALTGRLSLDWTPEPERKAIWCLAQQ